MISKPIPETRRHSTRLSSGAAAIGARGGRPALAGEALPQVVALTLLIVGGEDAPVIDLNRAASRRLRADHQLAVERLGRALRAGQERELEQLVRHRVN